MIPRSFAEVFPWMPLERVMTVARMADGRLVVHGAMALGSDEMKGTL